MLGGDSSSSQRWGMEEDEVVFLKQVTPCPISSLRREAGADLSFWVPQLSCPRLRQVSSEVQRCPKSKVICLKTKFKKNWQKAFLGSQKGNDLGRSSWLPEPCLDPATPASCWPWRPG